MSIRLTAATAALCLASAPAAAQPATPQLCPSAVAAIDAAAARTLAQGSPGMAVGVARHGQMVFERGYGFADLEHRAPVTPATVFKIASVTKQFTAVAVLLMVEDGRMKLDDTLANHVPELPQAHKVTLYQLLIQTSGIPDYAEDPTGSASKSVARTPAEMVGWIGRLTPAFNFKPGSQWAYSNSNYALLGLAVERAAGKPLRQVFEERLFRPAGLTATAWDDPAEIVPHRARGYRKAKDAAAGFNNADWISPSMPGPGGALRSTLGDLARWSHALFSGRILKPESLKLLTAAGRMNDGRTTKLGMPEAWRIGLNSDYAMGLFAAPSPAGPRFWHSGDIDGFSAWLGHYPERGLSIALMENSESADMDKAAVEAAVLGSLKPDGAPLSDCGA